MYLFSMVAQISTSEPPVKAGRFGAHKAGFVDDYHIGASAQYFGMLGYSSVSPPGLSTMHTGGFFYGRGRIGVRKAVLTFAQQSDLLIDRGLSCDRSDLILHLQDVGYYRLSGYWHIFKKPDNTFIEGTSFLKIWDIYTFDRQLRLLTLDAIERIEVYFRTQLAYRLSEAAGPFGFWIMKTCPVSIKNSIKS